LRGGKESEALKGYAKAQNLSKEMQNDIAEYNLYAFRQMGVISLEIEKTKANQYTKVLCSPKEQSTKSKTLENFGISRKYSAEAEKLALIPDGKFDEIISEQRKKDSLNKNTVLKEIKKNERKQNRLDLEEQGKTLTIDYDLRFGDFMEVFKDIPDNSIDCIITDPPYPYEFIDCWSNLFLILLHKPQLNLSSTNQCTA
jgi:hypothetical protein